MKCRTMTKQGNPRKHVLLFIDYTKVLIKNRTAEQSWKILTKMGSTSHFICLLRNRSWIKKYNKEPDMEEN